MRKKRTNKINRKHNDRLFLMVFREGGALLEHYNALNATAYTRRTWRLQLWKMPSTCVEE